MVVTSEVFNIAVITKLVLNLVLHMDKEILDISWDMLRLNKRLADAAMEANQRHNHDCKPLPDPWSFPCPCLNSCPSLAGLPSIFVVYRKNLRDRRRNIGTPFQQHAGSSDSEQSLSGSGTSKAYSRHRMIWMPERRLVRGGVRGGRIGE